jgi:hypothetical protein
MDLSARVVVIGASQGPEHHKGVAALYASQQAPATAPQTLKRPREQRARREHGAN